MTLLQLPFLRRLGWWLIPISLLLFLIPASLDSEQLSQSQQTYVFLGNFLITLLFGLLVLLHNSRIHRPKGLFRGNAQLYAQSLTLFSISAHSLNYLTEIQVFAPYRPEVLGYVLLMHLAILVFPFRKELPDWAQYGLYLLMGASAVFSIYQLAFLGPLVLLAFPMGIVLGISLHATVPLWYAIESIWAIWRMEPLRWARASYWVGVTVPLLVVLAFLIQWHSVQQTIEAEQQAYGRQTEGEVPQWVWFSQRLPEGAFLERVLMSPVQAQPSFWGEGLDRLGTNFRREGWMRHDPLAVMAGWLYGNLDLTKADLVPILESRYDIRHQTHRRLWRGTDLTTDSLQTRVKVWPAYRTAYLEKEIVVSNHDSWRQQEAVYSFYLPEGGVATSLSLWIEGVEQPARLTTKSKADSAYVQIVGVESRDPALMHWQEGNRLSVTVFPVPAGGSRRFKVGISVPLFETDGQLQVQEIPFDGPDLSRLVAETQLTWAGSPPAQPDLPLAWYQAQEIAGYQGGYVPNWQVSFPAPALASEPFSFGGFQYQLQRTDWTQTPFSPSEIVLDLNQAWNWLEVKAVWEQVQAYPVYAYLPQRIRLTEDNLWQVFQSCKGWQFSLLPLHQFPDPAHTLVISHSPEHSPLLSDLADSRYADQLQTYLAQQTQPIHWYHLSRDVSPLLRSLKELRLVQFAAGSVEQLGRQLKQQTFPIVPESDERIQVPGTGFSIQRSAGQQSSEAAPDHLMRFFAYQQLLRDIGPHYFEKEALEENWLRQAEAGFVVSPISSLVVLESQADYERFGIEENENTLGNANLAGDGSVPEPHEWLLLSLIALVVIGLFTKQRLGL